MVLDFWYCNNWLYQIPPHISYMQSSWLAWHDTEGPAYKEVKKPNLLLCVLAEAFDQLFPPCIVNTFNFCTVHKANKFSQLVKEVSMLFLAGT